MKVEVELHIRHTNDLANSLAKLLSIIEDIIIASTVRICIQRGKLVGSIESTQSKKQPTSTQPNLTSLLFS